MAKDIVSVAGVGGLGVVMLVLAAAQIGHAQVSVLPTSDRPAGYVVFAKVVVDTDDIYSAGRRQDTVIQLTNTGQESRVVECFAVDASSRCNNAQSGDVGTFRYCRTSADCRTGGVCLPQWSYINNTIVLTPDEPVGWMASAGTNLSLVDGIDGDGKITALGPYFLGELKCFEVDGTTIANTTTAPILANDLKGEATIYDVNSVNIITGAAGSVDAREYNAIGFQASATALPGECANGGNNGTPCATNAACTGGGTCSGGQALCLGASPGSGAVAGTTDCTTAAYAGCPSILVVDHFFDGAADPTTGEPITTDLTLVPCTENLATGPSVNGINGQTPTTAQILVFNEFEQRLSTSVNVNCFRETQLSLIDQSVGNEGSSVFNVAVQGTLTGQTRIRPVLSADVENGNGLLAIAEEFHRASVQPTGRTVSYSAAFNVDYIGTNGAKGDIVRYNVGP